MKINEHHQTIMQNNDENHQKSLNIYKNHQKWPRKPQIASMLHTCVGFGGPKWAHKQLKHIFTTFF